MSNKIYHFDNGTTQVYSEFHIKQLGQYFDRQNTWLFIDEIVYRLHEPFFSSWQVITLKADKAKCLSKVDEVAEILIKAGATRHIHIVGIGGGSITDFTGFFASIYKRGVLFSYIPTTVLGMVDAAIGGKTGVDCLHFKNMIGTFNHPQNVFIDVSLLNSLSEKEFANGFAEIIKHAVIADKEMFQVLEQKDLNYWCRNHQELNNLITKNIEIKASFVLEDEKEQHSRKILNFGHTFGHAIEHTYNLMHGEAVSIGMVIASQLAYQVFGYDLVKKLTNMLKHYQLPTSIDWEWHTIKDLLIADKKSNEFGVDFILVPQIGTPKIHNLSISELEDLINRMKD